MVHHVLMNNIRTKLVLVLLLGAFAFGALALTPKPAVAQQEPIACNLYDGPHPELARGETGEAVLHAQCLLNQFGFDIAEDGIFGRQTAGALTPVQRDSNLKDVDGIIGRCTWAALHQEAIPVECLDL
jgi:peptidoglycan hydrolase-like protein with peptidoglycan-binding domain